MHAELQGNKGFKLFTDTDVVHLRTKRDKLDTLTGINHHEHHHHDHHHHDHHHDHHSENDTNSVKGNIPNVGEQLSGFSNHTIGNLIDNLVRNSKDRILSSKQKKQLVCFTQNFGDDLSKNLEAAIQFNDLINDSNDWIIRNNRNTDPILLRSKAINDPKRSIQHLEHSSKNKNLKEWLNIEKSDIAILAKNLNKVVHPLPTILLPPQKDLIRQNQKNKSTNSPKGTESKIFPKHISSFSISENIGREFTNIGLQSNVNFNSINQLHDANTNQATNSLSSTKVKNGIVNLRERRRHAQDSTRHVNNHLQKYQDQQNRRLNEQRMNTIYNSPKQIKEPPNRLTAPIQERSLQLEDSDGAFDQINKLVNTLVDTPADTKNLQELLFPNKVVDLQIQKARQIYQRNLLTRKNDQVRIRSYEE